MWLFTGKFSGKNPTTVTSWISYCMQCICIGSKRYSYDFYWRGWKENEVDIKPPDKVKASCTYFFRQSSIHWFLIESKVCQDMFNQFNKESDRLDDFYCNKCNINR